MATSKIMVSNPISINYTLQNELSVIRGGIYRYRKLIVIQLRLKANNFTAGLAISGLPQALGSLAVEEDLCSIYATANQNVTKCVLEGNGNIYLTENLSNESIYINGCYIQA